MIEMNADDWKALAEWGLSHDTGLSSQFMARYITRLIEAGIQPDIIEVLSPWRIDWPHDSDDFGRCWRLVKHVPKLREGFPELREAHPIWREIVDHWDNMGWLLEEGWRTGQWGVWSRVREVSEILHNFEQEYYATLKANRRPVQLTMPSGTRVTISRDSGSPDRWTFRPEGDSQS